MEIFVNSIQKAGTIIEISNEDIISIEIDKKIQKFTPGEFYNLKKGE